ncbi:MAG: response regulator transcription factor [Anaerolineales bacterium]|nr:response regulator transcription factor [Anaerolineales bacterium]
MKALIVDDDLALADVIAFTLGRAGFETILAHDGQAALERWRAEAPDVIILDLNLPKLDGFAVCRRIRAEDDTPIVMLTVRNEDDDVVQGLTLGADDYVVKPFSPRQVVARVEAVLRRSSTPPSTPDPIVAGDLILEMSRLELCRGEKVLTTLTRLEARLLEILMSNCGQVLTTERLIEYVWGVSGGDRSMLKQLVYRLRHKVERDPTQPQYLETVPGVGYSFVWDRL